MEGRITSLTAEGKGLRVVISILDNGVEQGPFVETWPVGVDTKERLAGFVGLHEYSKQNAIDTQESPDEMLRAVLKEADPEVAKRVLQVDDAKLAELVDVI